MQHPSHPAPPGEPSRTALQVLFGLATLLMLVFVSVMWVAAITSGTPVVSFAGKTAAMIGAHFAGGNLANAGVGFQLQVPTWFIVYQCFMQDTILTLYAFALFAWGFKRIAHWPFIGPRLDEMHTTALYHSKMIRPYGVPGLMLFVIVPMWATGPIVGSIIGYIIGLGTWTTLITITVTNVLSTIFYVNAYGWLRDVNEQAAFGVLGLLGAFILIGGTIGVFRKLRGQSSTPTLPETGGDS